MVHGNKCPLVQCSSAMHFKHCVIVSEHNGKSVMRNNVEKPTGQERNGTKELKPNHNMTLMPALRILPIAREK